MASADLVQQLLTLDDGIDECEKKLSELKRSRSEAESLLKEEFIQEGIQSQKVAHNGESRTVYLHTSVGVGPIDGNRMAVIRALRECGLEKMVSDEPQYNTRTLGAFINSQQKAKLEVPSALKAVIKIEQLCFVRVRKS